MPGGLPHPHSHRKQTGSPGAAADPGGVASQPSGGPPEPHEGAEEEATEEENDKGQSTKGMVWSPRVQRLSL